jgi:hypothetical protein
MELLLKETIQQQCGGCCVKGCAIPYETMTFTWYESFTGDVLDTGMIYKARLLYDEDFTEEIHEDSFYGILHTGPSYFTVITESDYNECIWANRPSTTPYPDDVYHLFFEFPPGPPDGPNQCQFRWDTSGGFGAFYGPFSGTGDPHFIKGKYGATVEEFFDPEYDDWVIIE